MAPPRRSRRLALKHVSIGDLPEPALRRILLGSSNNLLRSVAACAGVCPEWWRLVRGSAAYGLALPRSRVEDLEDEYENDEDDERARVLKVIDHVLEEHEEDLCLDYAAIGDAGAAALGAALLAMPRIPYAHAELESNDLTAAGVTSLVPALRRPWGDDGLLELSLHDNPLSDAGVAALAKALPSTLQSLWLHNTGCGNEGCAALAARLPSLDELGYLSLCDNPAITGTGWVAMANGIPTAAPDAVNDGLVLKLENNPGLGSEGAAALAAAVPRCPGLGYLFLNGCGLDEAAKAAIRAAVRDRNRNWSQDAGRQFLQVQLDVSWNDYSPESDTDDDD